MMLLQTKVTRCADQSKTATCAPRAHHWCTAISCSQ